MKVQTYAVIELPAIALSFAENATDDMEKKPRRPNSVKLEAFTLRLAWTFASAVLLLMVVSLLLVVAGCAGSIFAPDVRPKTFSTSWARK